MPTLNRVALLASAFVLLLLWGQQARLEEAQKEAALWKNSALATTQALDETLDREKLLLVTLTQYRQKLTHITDGRAIERQTIEAAKTDETVRAWHGNVLPDAVCGLLK